MAEYAIDINQILPTAGQFLARNYDYLFLNTMLEQAAHTKSSGSTLITGSSHALNDIQENCWHNAFNCSMHSQDLYYDFQCARRVLEQNGENFTRCYIIMGYYIAYQDLSRSKVSREGIISNIYYPIFRDARHWDAPAPRDLWAGIGESLPDTLKRLCQQVAAQEIWKRGTYYSELRPRGTLFDLKGRTWAQVPEWERMAMGRARAADHNRLFQHKGSLEENKAVLAEFVRFLYAHEVQPIVVITPFSPEYNQFVLPEMKAGVGELLDAVPEDIHYVDFNQALDLFTPEDYMDTDHLSAQGAEKVSRILVEMFGA